MKQRRVCNEGGTGIGTPPIRRPPYSWRAGVPGATSLTSEPFHAAAENGRVDLGFHWAETPFWTRPLGIDHERG